MTKPIEHECFSRQGILTDDIIKENMVPSLGIGAADTLKQGGWDGKEPAISVGLTIGPTGERIRSAKVFGVGYHDNSWTISTSKLWGGKDGFKIAVNMKDANSLEFPSNTMYTSYINSDEVSWYVYRSVGEKAKVPKSEYKNCDIKNFCIRASVQLIDDKHAKVTYGIVPVSLDDLKQHYLEHFDKPGYPNIMFQQKTVPILPLAEDDWELPSNVVPLFLDERVGDSAEELPEVNEIWTKFSQFLRSSTNPNLVKDYKEWVAYLNDDPTFEALPSEWTWPLYSNKPAKANSGWEIIDHKSCSISFRQC